MQRGYVMPSIKLRDGRSTGSRMMTSTLSNELMVLAIGSAIEAAENGHNVELTVNSDHIEVLVNELIASE
jgi:hypothetical protein